MSYFVMVCPRFSYNSWCSIAPWQSIIVNKQAEEPSVGKHTGGFFYGWVSGNVGELHDQELRGFEKADPEDAESPEKGHW